MEKWIVIIGGVILLLVVIVVYLTMTVSEQKEKIESIMAKAQSDI